MAKKRDNTGLLVLLGAGAVGLALLATSKKASASSNNLGVNPVPPLPTVELDADDEGEPVPRMLEQVEPSQSSKMPPRYVPVTSMPAESPDRVVPALSRPGETWSVTSEDGSPVSANAGLARQKAQAIADHVRSKKSGYDRPKLAVWQALAGLPGVDGLYGPATQSALQRMGAKNVPKPLFKGGN